MTLESIRTWARRWSKLRRRGVAGSADTVDVAHSLDRLARDCQLIMTDVGASSYSLVATRILRRYATLDDRGKAGFFHLVLDEYAADSQKITAAYAAWEQSRQHQDLSALFEAVEPARQQLFRRLNYAVGGTLGLIRIRADLLRIMRKDQELRAVDDDLRHLLNSWFNLGFLQMREVTWSSSKELRRYLFDGERVHPMNHPSELRARMRPSSRRYYAFFHPATGDIPVIFVEVALVKGVPQSMAPLLDPRPSTKLSQADTAALYSINSAMDGLAGIQFGGHLIKRVIDEVGSTFPQLTAFVTLSPLPGFRTWLDGKSASDDTGSLSTLRADLERLELSGNRAGADPEQISGVRSRLLPLLAQYVLHERRHDGKPLDAVARFHLSNGASAWQINWPAHDADYAWKQSYGAMINYRYQLDRIDENQTAYARGEAIARGPQLNELLPSTPTVSRRPTT